MTAWSTIPWLAANLPRAGNLPAVRDGLVALGRRQVAADRAIRAAIRDTVAFEQYHARVRQHFWAAVGGQPPRTDLRARVVDVLLRPGYRIEKVLFESVPW